MTQYKDKSAKHADNINSGLFTYPVLMAADILLYQADLVPVGEDQRQHLEMTRDIAERFNKIYGDTFKVPEGYIPKAAARIMGLQNPEAKMSKSSNLENDSIFLDDEPDIILKKFKKSVTDSENVVRYDVESKPGISNLMSIYGAITGTSKEEIEKEFAEKGYGDFKTAVAEAVIDELKPLQKKYKELKENPEYLEKIYRKRSRKSKQNRPPNPSRRISKNRNYSITEFGKEASIGMLRLLRLCLLQRQYAVAGVRGRYPLRRT